MKLEDIIKQYGVPDPSMSGNYREVASHWILWATRKSTESSSTLT
jgi:hypothetical protein